jgi:D-proline reductase (dithiol) PrdB
MDASGWIASPERPVAAALETHMPPRYGWINAALVQVFKHVPRLASRWARTHQFVEGRDIPWSPVRKPVAESKIALVTTAGVHLTSHEPFNMDDPDGDPSFRVIPTDAPRADLTITHKYYDHSAADRDINVVLPLDRLRELLAEKRIGGIGHSVYGFMGHIDGPHLETLQGRTAPEVARRLKTDRVDAVLITPA